MSQDRKLTTTQVLVPLNQSNTLHHHIHVSVRLKPFTEQEQSMQQQKRGQWDVLDDTTL